MKKLIMLILSVALILSFAVNAAAAGNVTYSGDSGKFVFAPGSEHSPTDLFTDFKSVMPGDTIGQTITVKNDASNKVKVKLYLRALGAHKESEELLSKLQLSVQTKEGASLFDAPANETAGLTDWVELGTLYSGGVTDLTVILTVPAELDNTYAGKIGMLDWEFMVEEFPDDTSPGTGDNTNVTNWVVIAVTAAILLVIMIVVSRNAQKRSDKPLKKWLWQN